MPARRPYATDLSNDEWQILEPLVPKAKPGGRPRAHETRELLNAIFYVLRGGCAWRLLPHDFFLPWQTAYHYFRAWRMDGTWKQIHTISCARGCVAWRAESLPPAPPSSTPKQPRLPREAVLVVTTAARRSAVESDICSLTQKALCSTLWSTLPM
jgi:transposase